MAKIDESKQLPLLRKYQIFVNGYEIDVATGISPGVASRELNEPVYGEDNPLTQTVSDNGTMSMDVKRKSENNYLLDNLYDVSPDIAAKGYNFDNVVKVCFWENRQSYNNGKYIGCNFYGRVSMLPTARTGAPNEWNGQTFTGVGDTARSFEIDNVAIASEKVAVAGGSGTLTDTPTVCPDDSMYALYVVAMNYTEGTHVVEESEILTVTAAMVAVDKSVTIATGDLSEMAIGDVNAAFIVYLSSGAGVYPTGDITIEGLYGTAA